MSHPFQSEIDDDTGLRALFSPLGSFRNPFEVSVVAIDVCLGECTNEILYLNDRA